MNWLGHHEFGLDHLPFSFARSAMDPALKPDDPNYWLDYWCAVHEHVLNDDRERMVLVCHEDLRERPRAVLRQLLAFIGAAADLEALVQQVEGPTQQRRTDEFDASTQRRAVAAYDELKAKKMVAK